MPPSSPPLPFAFWSVVKAAVFCSSKLHDSTTIEEGGREGSEHARKITIGDISSCGRVILRGNGKPDQRSNDIPKVWLGPKRGKEGRKAECKPGLLSPRYAHSGIPERKFSSGLTPQRGLDPPFSPPCLLLQLIRSHEIQAVMYTGH